MEKVSFFCLVAIAVPVNAQNTATAWTGVVRTAAGEPIAGAKVTVSSTQAKKQTAVTGSKGQFAIAGLASGPHTIIVKLTGEDPTAPLALDITGASVVLK